MSESLGVSNVVGPLVRSDGMPQAVQVDISDTGIPGGQWPSEYRWDLVTGQLKYTEYRAGGGVFETDGTVTSGGSLGFFRPDANGAVLGVAYTMWGTPPLDVLMAFSWAGNHFEINAFVTFTITNVRTGLVSSPFTYSPANVDVYT